MVTETILRIAESGIGLVSQILARTSPKEFKELSALLKLKLKYNGLITDYKALLPSVRRQGKLEFYIKELGKVEDGILIHTEIANTKLEIMLSQHNNTPDSSD